MKIGKTIRELRRGLRIKQRHLAQASKITPSYLSRIENDPTIIPSIKLTDSLARNLGTSAPVLIAMSLTEEDIDKGQRPVFRILYPHIQNMLMQVVKDKLL